MQGRRNSTDPMDISGRSTSSSGSMPSQSNNGFPMPPMMGPQQRFQPGSPYGPGFPGPQSPQQQQRFYQMQMQQHQMQQMQQLRQNIQPPPLSPRNTAPPYQQQQQQQMTHPQLLQPSRRGSGAAMSPPSLARPLDTMPPSSPAASISQTTTASHASSSTAPVAPKQPPNKPPTNGSSTTEPPPAASSSSQPVKPKKAASTKPKPAAPTIPMLSTAETQQMLAQTDWVDKTLWVSRQMFGGQALNGFLRATATVQRVKKQRARQTASTRAAKAENEKKGELSEQEAEEVLKKEVMNARTAKKIKTEMEAGLEFCELLHGTIRNLLQEMTPQLAPIPPLGMELPNPNAKNPPPPQLIAPLPPSSQTTAPPPAVAPSSAPAAVAPKPPQVVAPKAASAKSNKTSLPPASPMLKTAPFTHASAASTASPGNPNGSTLRKLRRKKLPPSNEPPVQLSEYDESGKTKYSKKELAHRVSEVIRFRTLRKGDFVAARLTSRDLWILARVLKDCKGIDNSFPPAKFLQLSHAKRDQYFREKVQLKDVEEKHGTADFVARHLVLPLPRSFSEAAEWGQRAKKGSRVYAMYPQTTSLYSATVVDNTTFCRNDDDIIVVVFDGDEPDPVTGLIPKCHIPARFVTLIPREFPASQSNTSKKRKASDSGTSAAIAQSAAAALLDDPLNGVLDDSLFDGALPGLEGFDDLDFDLLGGT